MDKVEEVKKILRDVLQDFDQYSPCLHRALLDKTASIKDARYRQATKDDHAGKPLDLTDDEFEIYSSIQSAATIKSEARIEALIEAVEKASHPMNTNMTGISLSKETWQVLKATHTNNKEKADG